MHKLNVSWKEIKISIGNCSQVTHNKIIFTQPINPWPLPRWWAYSQSFANNSHWWKIAKPCYGLASILGGRYPEAARCAPGYAALVATKSCSPSSSSIPLIDGGDVHRRNLGFTCELIFSRFSPWLIFAGPSLAWRADGVTACGHYHNSQLTAGPRVINCSLVTALPQTSGHNGCNS